MTVKLGDERATTATAPKAESRRLLLEPLTTRPGKFVTRTFILAVKRPQLNGGPSAVTLKPREHGTLDWNNSPRNTTVKPYGN
ncbi:hypothetical protein H8B15_03525 [Hymenobacter sp. BT507]|uniref:Uncharacterized protein n=1 Tax=Hymenobacter citatus TaxID=2763506 RepID=A0ABR7MFV6_9BACT|nr:hypothetical protein [Hymenobacter citatus]MBC6609976.1 hypothetical protein [Hymenobacter citatus]